MSRANVASVSARADAWHCFVVFVAAKFAAAKRIVGRMAGRISASPHLRVIHSEHRATWAFPAVLLSFIAILCAISMTFTYDEQDRVIAAATNDIELSAAVIVADIDVQLRAAPANTPADLLAHALPLRALGRGQRVLLSDENGTIIANYPHAKTSDKTNDKTNDKSWTKPAGKATDRTMGTIADHLGTTQPLTILADKAGVMRILLPDGSDALATVRSLRAPFGQIAIIHPMTNVLSDWRAGFTRTIVLLCCTAFVLAALALAYLRQITKAQAADNSCRIMRDRVDMVLSRGRCGLWDWNLAEDEIDWSLSMFEIVGMAPRAAALSASEFLALIHPEDGRVETAIRALIRGEVQAIDEIFRMRDADGGWVWLRAKAELVEGGGRRHVVGIASDITETMAFEERTAKADMRLRDAIETISEAFVVWDANNRLVMCNSKFQRFHSLPPQAVAVGTPYAEVMANGAPLLIQSQVALGMPQPMGARTFEAQLGDGRWLQINERRTKDGGYVSVGTDITALKRHEEQLIESERRLMNSVVDLRRSRQILETQAQQLAELADKYREQKAEAENANRAKSRFLANMGHELRTPLNAILGFSEIMMLESYGELGSPLYAEYCKDIHTSGQYLLNVIADVLEMSRLEAGRVRLEKLDFIVADAVAAAVALVAPLAEAGSVSIAASVPFETKLMADRAAVEKILVILLENAVKYTPAKGRVAVRTRPLQNLIEIIVEDTGIGISPEIIARLGRPFEQSEQALKNGMSGSGLGLAIARSLVDLHGGTMQIRSELGQGTLVLVHLPCQRNTIAPRPQLAVAAAGGPNAARVHARPSRFALQPAERSIRKLSRTA